jgi:hypothetical protein
VTQRKNKHGGGFFAGDADDYTVRSAYAFDLNPLAPTRPVATVCLLGDDTFEAGNFAQPLLCQEWIRCLKNQLQAWMEAFEELLQIASPLAKGQIHEICAGTLEHIEDQKDRRALDCRLPTAPRRHSQPALQSAKVRLPMLIGDNNFTVEHS